MLVSAYPASLSQPVTDARRFPTVAPCAGRDHGQTTGHVPSQNGQPNYGHPVPPVRLHASGPSIPKMPSLSSTPSSASMPTYPCPETLSSQDHPMLIPPSDSVPTVHVKVAAKPNNSVSFADLPLYCLNRDALVTVLSAHGVRRSHDKRKVGDLLELALTHHCNAACVHRRFTLSHDYSNLSLKEVTAAEARSSLTKLLEKRLAQKFPRKINAPKKRAIIEEWIDTISNSSMEQVVCAVCAERILRSQSEFLSPTDAQLAFLCNDKLPPMVRPPPHPIFGNALLEPGNLGRRQRQEFRRGLRYANGHYCLGDREARVQVYHQ